MGDIHASTDALKGLTIYRATGKVSAKQIIATLKTFYLNSPTPHALWDFSKADLSDVSTEDLQKILSASKLLSQSEKGGKRAIVALRDIEYGLGRMYDNLAHIHEHTFLFNVFRTEKEAAEWLLMED